jgi:uncharacterized protein (DUF433 family)
MQVEETKELEHDKIDVYEAPSYRAAEAARILVIPPSTVNAWCFGQGYTTKEGDLRTFQPVIRPADYRRRLLSFANLCELHVLSSITRSYRIPLQQVRPALQYVREQLGIERPLLERDFQTNGISLFLTYAGQLINVSRGGQVALRGDLEAALDRIERGGAAGRPIRLFPFSRPIAKAAEQPRIIAIDPQIGFGRPIVVPARVRTEVIIDRFEAGDSPSEMAADYGVTEAEILEAVRFEYRLAA